MEEEINAMIEAEMKPFKWTKPLINIYLKLMYKSSVYYLRSFQKDSVFSELTVFMNMCPLLSFLSTYFNLGEK